MTWGGCEDSQREVREHGAGRDTGWENFGWGRQMNYAGPQALRELFGGGHYGTVKAHSDRRQAFIRWYTSQDGPGFNDGRQVDRNTLLGYAGCVHGLVERGEVAISTAQNRLSSVNRTLEALRGDHQVRIPSPSKTLGMKRGRVRVSVPQGQDRQLFIRVIDAPRH